ncbi:hypothetical protein A9Q98_08040 [Thalassotalea sp. 42_200_T64]|nr:hypothetical protein A9Q98_08040 [Thalassotalea sp. 42_200_T64]
MVWTRGVAGGDVGKYSISLNAILIIVFASLAVYFAIKRDIKTLMSIVLMFLTLAMAAGIFSASMGMWLPRI